MSFDLLPLTSDSLDSTNPDESSAFLDFGSKYLCYINDENAKTSEQLVTCDKSFEDDSADKMIKVQPLEGSAMDVKKPQIKVM